MIKQHLQIMNNLFRPIGLLIIAGGLSFASIADAYNYDDKALSGNMLTFTNVKLEQSANTPNIRIGELTLTNHTNGDREGFIRADEVTVKNLQLTYTLDGINITVSMPEAYFENYEGPDFSKTQLGDHDFVHPAWNWALLTVQAFSDRAIYSEGLTLTFASDDIEVKLTNGHYEATNKNGRFSSSRDGMNVEIKTLANESTIYFELGANRSEGRGGFQDFAKSFINPEAYPSAADVVIEKNYLSHMVLRLVTPLDDQLMYSRYEDLNEINVKIPAFSQQQRQMVANLVHRLATHGAPKNNHDLGGFSDLLDKETVLSLLDNLLSISREKSSIKSVTSEQQVKTFRNDTFTVDLMINGIEIFGQKGVGFDRISYGNVQYNLSENNTLFGELSLDSLVWERFDYNKTISTFAEVLIDAIMKGDDDFEENLSDGLLAKSLDQIYPRFGNVKLSHLSVNAPPQKLDISVDEISTQSSDNPGMADSGSFAIKRLVIPASSVSHFGPAASLLAGNDGNLTLSALIDWRADNEGGGYSLETIKAELQDGIEIVLSADIGGLGQGWQSRPLSELFNLVKATRIGFKGAGLSLKDLGLHKRLLSLAPLMTGLSDDEIKTMAKTTVKDNLSFIGSEAFMTPLIEGVGNFINQGGYVGIQLKPKIAEIMPFIEFEPTIKNNLGRMEEVFTYEITTTP